MMRLVNPRRVFDGNGIDMMPSEGKVFVHSEYNVYKTNCDGPLDVEFIRARNAHLISVDGDPEFRWWSYTTSTEPPVVSRGWLSDDLEDRPIDELTIEVIEHNKDELMLRNGWGIYVPYEHWFDNQLRNCTNQWDDVDEKRLTALQNVPSFALDVLKADDFIAFYRIAQPLEKI